jgi:hypothetical protein
MRRVPAILMVVFLVCPLFFAALLTISVSTWALDRGFYTQLISDARLYQVPALPDGSMTWIASEMPGLQSVSFTHGARALREILTPEYMRTQAVRALNQVFDILEARGGADDISIDLSPVKTALLGDAGMRFSKALAQDLPVGGVDFSIRQGRLPALRPASVSVDRAAAVIQQGLPGFVRTIPDTVRLSDNPSFRGSAFAMRWGPRFPLLGALILADIVLLILAGGLWVAAAFIGGANRFERLQWLGWSLLVPAAGVFLIGLVTILPIVFPWVRWGIESARLDHNGFSASFVAALLDLVRHALARVGGGFLAAGAIATGSAIGLLAWSWSMPLETRKEGRNI